MLLFTIKRFALAALILVVAVTVMFLMIRAVPGDPVSIMLGPRATPELKAKLMQEMAGATVIGPILSGIGKSVQLCSTGSTVNDILNMAVIAACRVD